MYCVELDQPVSGKKSPESTNPPVHICSLDSFGELPLLARVQPQRARRLTLCAFILATALNLAGCDREPSVVYISEYRADHTRVFIFSQPGRYWIRGSSAVRCGDPQVTVPAELEVRVRGREDG